MRQFFRRIAEWLPQHLTIVGLFLAVLIGGGDILLYRHELARSRVGEDSFLRLSEYRFRDFCVRELRGRRPPPPAVVVVTVDERSVAQVAPVQIDGVRYELGRFPWPRRTIAKLIDEVSAQRPRVIASDIMFTEAESPEARRELTQTIADLEAKGLPEAVKQEVLDRLRAQLAYIDGDGALAAALTRARARGVRDVILPFYFIEAADRSPFSGHRLTGEAATFFQANAVLRKLPAKEEEWRFRWVMGDKAFPGGMTVPRERGVVANIPRLTTLVTPDFDPICSQASVDNRADADGVLRNEFLLAEYPVDLKQRREQLDHWTAGGERIQRGDLFLPLGVRSYMSYAGWTLNDVIADFTGALVFERQPAAPVEAAGDFGDGFGDDFGDDFGEADDGTEAWVEVPPLTPPPPLRVPLNPAGQYMINFYGPRYEFTYFSALDVLQHSIPKTALQDKIVLIGNTDIGHADFKPSPFGLQFPGVEKHATIAANLLDRSFLQDGDDLGSANLIAIALLCLAIGLTVPRLDILLGTLVTLVAIAAYLGWTYHSFTSLGVFRNMSHPVAAALTTFVSITVVRVVAEQATGKAIRNTFEHFVDAKVVDSLLERGGKIELGGESREVSIFFSDIAGFTSISESMPPDQLFDQLNEYLSAATDILLNHNGLIDKYIGDAIMAGFGIPLPSDNSAWEACHGALQAQHHIRGMARHWEAQGRSGFATRMGINTGMCHVGLLGSSLRMDYSMIGDSVNLAARLESINKTYGTYICISETTEARLDEHFLRRKMDMVKVKGKTKPVSIFELMGHTDFGIADDLHERAGRFTEAATLYYQGVFDKAGERFAALAKDFPSDGLAEMFVQRCQEFEHNPPGDDWDGSYTMKTK